MAFVSASINAQTPTENRNQLPEIGVVASDALTIEKEKILGDAIMKQLRGQAPLVNDPVLQEYIQDLGNRLVIHADNTKFPFKFFIINNPVLNAFAFYGGHVGMHSGLISRAQTESELASVVAHEIAHVTQRHLARRVQAQQRNSPLQLASMLGSILVALADPQAGLAALSASVAGNQQAQINFTRNNEQEADNIGINILYRAGFDPAGAPAFFSRLAEQARGQSTQLAFLRTHPLPQERVAETITRARTYGERRLPPSLSFHLAQARINARYMLTPQRAFEYYQRAVSQTRAAHLSTVSSNDAIHRASKYGLAIAYFEQENYQEAEKIVLDLLLDDKENLFYLDLLTDVYIKQEKYSSAINLLTPIWQLKPKNRVLALNLANAHMFSENYGTSIQILRDLLLVDNQDLLSYQLLQDAYQRTQNKKEAHQTQAEIYALISAYSLAIDELQFAYNFAGTDNIEKQRIKGRIEQIRKSQEMMQRLSL
ncbi:beta-barrel assembly-enhancing protease [Agaribacter flavus]|uniref:Putative beta-barrel assembly-enhancing protease n=1 Tax=Agaribacter flavus TaxID=1902781 RepID=A0ABV7FR00_9ALTE